MDRRRLLRAGTAVVAIALGVAASSVAVAFLEGAVGVGNASSVYLVTVAAAAIGAGIPAAALTAVASVLVYNFWFTEPRFTFIVSDPAEWLNLVLLLFVAVTVGELAGLQRRRAEVALARERESRALFELTRALATRDSTEAALPGVADALARAGGFGLVWFTAGADDAEERPIARSGSGPLPPTGRAYAVLHQSADGQSGWTAVRGPGAASDRGRAEPPTTLLYRIRLRDGGRPIGSLWATRERAAGPPDEAATTLARVGADLVAQALAHDRLEEQGRQAAIARQSDALKTALVESVSHDLRTPLASIRASAGTLMDPEVRLSPDEARAAAATIDREAQRLNRLVGNLLDLSRIEAGALVVAEEALDLEDVVSRAITLVEARAGLRRIEIAGTDDRAVLADPILLEEVLVNLLENAVRHTPEGSTVRITSRPAERPEVVRLTVEDSGPGVPPDDLSRIFDKFYRAVDGRRSTRAGMGIGLAVVRGFSEAMGGRVSARRGDLGGLAVDLDLRAAAVAVDAGPVPAGGSDRSAAGS